MYGGFHRGRVGFEDAPHALGKIGVVLILPGHDDGLRADAQRFAEAHRRFHTEELRFVARRSYTAASDQNGFAAQRGIQHLLDGCEKRVHVHVHDVGNGVGNRDGNFTAGIFARSPPGPGGPWIFLRFRFRLRRFGGTRNSSGILRAKALSTIAPRYNFLLRVSLLMFMMRVGRCRAILFLGGCLNHVDGFYGRGDEYVFDADVHGGSWQGSEGIYCPPSVADRNGARFLCAVDIPVVSTGSPGWVFGIEGSSCKSTPHPAYGSELSTGGGRLVRA